MGDIAKSGWFGVRCVFDCGLSDLGDTETSRAYEERVTLWQADDLNAAIALAEAEAEEYAEMIEVTFLGLSQAYMMADDLGPGAEVFSLIRIADLPPTAYLDRFFSTGTERQTEWTP